MLQLELKFARQAELQHRIIGPEDLRQHVLRQQAGQLPFVGVTLLGQLFAFLEGDRHAHLRMHQQVVLRQTAGKEHAMPVLIGALADKVGHGAVGKRIAELAAARSQVVAQPALLLVHVLIGPGFVHGQSFQRQSRAFFSDIPRQDDGVFQFSALFRG
ncbi:MAG: hypothetical protein BWY83_01492 [bacterium ADurb.Bin478]|nr:MAG: hypothetical protein BWY83_01492 [bacterium ADurb.Bin478]